MPNIPLIFIVLGIAAVVIVAISVLRTISLFSSGKADGLATAFLATGALVPMIACASVVITYLIMLGPEPPPRISQETSNTALILGTSIALLLWLVAALLYTSFTSVDRANVTSYNELRQRLDELKARLESLCGMKEAVSIRTPLSPPDPFSPPDADKRQCPACIEAQGHYDFIAEKLGVQSGGSSGGSSGSLPWVLGTGYIDLWRRIHHAEEALISIMPCEEVIQEAVHDQLRLNGSEIQNRLALSATLRHAVSLLSGRAMRFLEPLWTVGTDVSSESPPNAPIRDENDQLARSMLREVRCVINDFRDDRWEGLVRARNQLIQTVTVTGLVLFLMVAFFIIIQVPREAIVAGAVFFLVGAFVGLFNRQREEAQIDVYSEDDYGLARARLINTPLLSGAAALGGVLLIAFLPKLLDEDLLAPLSATPTVTATVAATAPATATVRAAATATVTSTVNPTSTTAPVGFRASLARSQPLVQGQPIFTPTPTATSLPEGDTEPTATSIAVATFTPTATATATPTTEEAIATATTTATASPSPTASTAQTAQADGDQSERDLPFLQDIFNLERNRFGLILAAIFGLAPTRLINALQNQRIAQYKWDLKSSEAPESNRNRTS